MIQVARFISVVFNAPLNAFFYIPFVLVYSSSKSFPKSLIWASFSSIFALIILAVSFLLVKKGIFVNMDVSLRLQRIKLFIIYALTTLLYFWGIILFHAPKILMLVIIGNTLGILVFEYVNRRLKASAHISTFTALIFSIIFLIGGYTFLVITLIPILAWSRVKLKRHKIEEVYVGFFIGVVITIASFIIAQLFHLI